MHNEVLKKISELLKSFNNTFELEAKVIEDEDGEAVELTINGNKNNGAEFINITHETFNSIVQTVSDEHEVIYHPEKGLQVAKKIVKTDYVIEDFD